MKDNIPTMVMIEDLKPHPRNKEFFDDIYGDRWDDFKDSIKRRGVVEAIVITQDNIIVSGHQRVRACKELGLLNIPCTIRVYKDYDEELKRTKEDMILEDLISTNIMQRGIGNVNPMKMARCIQELERIKGIRQGSAGGNGSNQYSKKELEGDNLAQATQSDLANELKISQKQLQDYKKLTALIPELQQMIENGSMKATVGYKIWAKMSEEEQEKFFNEIGKEKLKTMTQKATKEYIEKVQEKEIENEKLKQELQKEKNKPKEVITETIDNTDHTLQNKLKKIQKELEEKEHEAETLKKKLDVMTERAEIFEENSNNYKDLKRQIEVLSKEKDDIGKAVRSGTELSGLVFKIENMLKTELCPITYSRAIMDMSSNKTVMNNLRDIIEVVEKWCNDMRKYLVNDDNTNNMIIDVEEK